MGFISYGQFLLLKYPFVTLPFVLLAPLFSMFLNHFIGTTVLNRAKSPKQLYLRLSLVNKMGKPMEIVNGKLLPQFSGKMVSITGLVTSAQPNGMTFEMRTVDDVSVKVQMKKPHQGPIDGYVEVHGLSQGQSVTCDELIEFTMEDGAEFDVAGHNSLCMLLHSLPRMWDLE